ncbi:MAG: signal recognition particle-docking protein FtsY [Bacteroidia bacterium]|nr:signal recognition particle-docking protein FtsY [Bacteroidia bacterium]
MAFFGFFGKKENKEKLEQGLTKTKTGFFDRLKSVVLGKSKVDDDVLDELEDVLIAGDVGVQTTLKIIKNIQNRVSADKYVSTSELDGILKEEVSSLLLRHTASDEIDFEVPSVENEGKKVPYVIMIVGVNGVGKTTTIGKLAYQLQLRGYSVLLGAADTFRAAAVDQLKLWAARVGVPIVEKGMNADPAAVAYEAVAEGIKQNVDVVIIDTAGRLHTKVNLMNELSKIKRSMTKALDNAPHEVILVLDASTGQNAIVQATEFTKATQVSALALTKLDGTAKGGVVIGISDMFRIPVKYLGVGEGINDLQVFDPKVFVDTLFDK